MNINDFKPMPVSFPEMFKLQTELKFLFEPDAKEVYENFDINCYSDQVIFRDYCWRICEELAESMEALDDDSEYDHYKEELIDGLNFVMDLVSLYGWSYSDVEFCNAPRCTRKITRSEALVEVVKAVGLTANCLKSRKWRSSQYLVDLLVFEKRLKKVWETYMTLLHLTMATSEIREIWSLKYQVNMFRVKSNY